MLTEKQRNNYRELHNKIKLRLEEMHLSLKAIQSISILR